MSWHFGIPDFIGMYTYFTSLSDTSHNIPSAAKRKNYLFNLATGAAADAAGALQMPQNLEIASNFLAAVATSERQKEMAAISSFCNSTGQQFPALQPYLDNPASIYNKPDEFYTQLTAALNIARKGTEQYLTELKRIKSNMEESGRTLQNYKADDYRYRIVGDISSFLNRLRGDYSLRNQKEGGDYNVKIQNLVMRVLDKAGLTQKIANGEDFAAIASTLLIQIEQEVQKVMDEVAKETNEKDISKITDAALDDIEKKYLAIASKEQAAVTPIQQAITDISGIEFARITANAKELLGLKTTELEKTITQIDTLKKRVSGRDKRARNKKSELYEIRQKIRKNKKLNQSLMLTTFTISGSQDSKHGTTYELIESLLDGGTKVKGNGATDIMTFVIGWERHTDDAVLNTLLNNISEEITASVTEQQAYTEGTIKDTREAITKMNKAITKLVSEAEQQLSEMKKYHLEDIFIFHESLKLYSSAETGRGPHGGFGGRKIGILSYIDQLYTMNMAVPLDFNDMRFLALNLMKDAVGAEYKDAIEHYLSMFAGMIMFDDLANMAQEAIAQVNTTSGGVKQIHLYNLNGIYVPASMMLTYISDSVQKASEFANNGLAAQATISAPSVSKEYNLWKDSGHHLSPDVWQRVAAEAAANTKVSITFLAAFKAFINKLGSL